MSVDATARFQAPSHTSAPSGATKVRFIIVGLCFIGLVMNYIDRANLSVALPYIDRDLALNLSNKEKGLILGAFFLGLRRRNARRGLVHG
jgi:sugar phosphate permease